MIFRFLIICSPELRSLRVIFARLGTFFVSALAQMLARALLSVALGQLADTGRPLCDVTQLLAL